MPFIPEFFAMPAVSPESVLCSFAVGGAFFIIWPRLANFIEYRVLSRTVKNVTGHSTLRPRSIKVGRNLSAAYDSVKKALAARQSNQRWHLHQVRIDEPIEKAIRLEGVSILKESPEEEMHRSRSEARETGRGRHSTSLRIQVDITERAGETQVSWKFLPEDQRYFSEKLQTMDANTSLLLLRTNFNLIKELGLTA
ncbi:MAG: hypothetical protein K2Y32_12925 [Candidatus Obscuribacterales bacterium]|nr:hypothetical protein [Candidatus Obscuribacterales bacterium]